MLKPCEHDLDFTTCFFACAVVCFSTLYFGGGGRKCIQAKRKLSLLPGWRNLGLLRLVIRPCAYVSASAMHPEAGPVDVWPRAHEPEIQSILFFLGFCRCLNSTKLQQLYRLLHIMRKKDIGSNSSHPKRVFYCVDRMWLFKKKSPSVDSEKTLLGREEFSTIDKGSLCIHKRTQVVRCHWKSARPDMLIFSVSTRARDAATHAQAN